MPIDVRSPQVRRVPEHWLRGAPGPRKREPDTARVCACREGFTLIEAAVVLLLLGASAALALPSMRSGLDGMRAAAAARHVAALARSIRVSTRGPLPPPCTRRAWRSCIALSVESQ